MTLSDGSTLKGNFFLNPQERIIDMLNDERHFLLFADSDGVITVVAKAAITSIRRVSSPWAGRHSCTTPITNVRSTTTRSCASDGRCRIH